MRFEKDKLGTASKNIFNACIKVGLSALFLYPLFLAMKNGYVCISYDPLELMDALDKVLTQTDLEPDVRKRATDLRNSLHENDNDILIIGKLKQ